MTIRRGYCPLCKMFPVWVIACVVDADEPNPNGGDELVGVVMEWSEDRYVATNRYDDGTRGVSELHEKRAYDTDEYYCQDCTPAMSEVEWKDWTP